MKKYQSNHKPSIIMLGITSAAFCISIFLNKWILLVVTLIWIANICYCIHDTTKTNMGGFRNFLKVSEELGEKNLKDGKENQKTSQMIRGGIQFNIIPVLVLAIFSLTCSILWLILL